MENSEQDHLTNMDLQIDNQVRQQLGEAGKWTKFISIVVFIVCGLLLILGIIGGATIGNSFRRFEEIYGSAVFFNSTFMVIVILLFVVILTLTYYFLFNFSSKIKNALLSDNTVELNTGLKSLKTFFIISTVLAILSLLVSLYNFINH